MKEYILENSVLSFLTKNPQKWYTPESIIYMITGKLAPVSLLDVVLPHLYQLFLQNKVQFCAGETIGLDGGVYSIAPFGHINDIYK